MNSRKPGNRPRRRLLPMQTTGRLCRSNDWVQAVELSGVASAPELRCALDEVVRPGVDESRPAAGICGEPFMQHRTPNVLVEALEGRRLLAAAPTAQADLVGTFDGAARVAFSPHDFHKPAADSIGLSIGTEGSGGSVAGTLTDQFGGALALSGTVSGRRLTANVTGSGASGELVGQLRPDGTVLTGRLLLSSGSGESEVHWRGQVFLHRQPGMLGLFPRYAGRGHGISVIDPGTPSSATRPRHTISITITSQSSDGSATADIEGLPFHGAVVGRVTGDSFVFQFEPQFVSVPGATVSSVSGTISLNGRLLVGQYDTHV
jgi:hypothetical protein